jgi:hypothetical protein
MYIIFDEIGVLFLVVCITKYIRKRISKMKQLFINVLLFIIAILLLFIISPINFIFVLLNGGSLNGFLLSQATTIDKFAGYEFRTLWNSTLIKGERKQEFNDIRFTMSYFLGINKERNSLTKTGKFVCWVLNLIDKNHVEKAVESVRKKILN